MQILKILLLSLLFLVTFANTAFTQVRHEVVNIGNDNDITIKGPSYTGLLDLSLFGTYQFETIYLADEMNITADGELTAIEFYVTGGLSADLLNNTTFYLKTTNQSSLSDGDISNPANEGYTQVDGSFTLLGLSLDDGDLVRFELDEGFPVDQGDNLAIHTRGGAILGVSVGENFYVTSTGSDDLTKASELGLLGLSWDPMEVTDLRPNVQLEFESEFEVSAGNSVITVQRPQILADGSSTTLVTLQVRTSTGENVNSGGDSVNFSTNRGSISSANDNGDGTYTAVLTSSDSPGTAIVTATLNGANVGDNVEVEFLESLAEMYCTDLDSEDVQIGNITSATTPRGPLFSNIASLTLGTYQFETIYLQNELNLDGPGFLNAIEFFVDSDINIDILGNVGVYVRETNNNSLSEGDVSLDGYTFVGGNASLLNVSVSGQRRLRVELETPFFYSNNNNLAVHVRHAILADVNVGGEFHYTTANENRTKVSQDFIGLLGITVGLTPPEHTSQRPDVNFEFDLLTSASLSESILTANPSERPADGTSASVITAMIRKSDGSVCIPESGAPEIFTTLGDFGSITDEGDGEYTVPLTSTTQGTAIVSAEVDGGELDDKPNVEFTPVVLPPSPDFTTIEASPTEIAANGSSTSQITVTLRDENDDPITTGGFSVNLLTTAGTLSSIADNGDGTYTATLTSSTAVETATISGTLEGENIDDTAQVDFTVLPPSPEFTTITASPNNILADGSSTSEITITLRDEIDNPVTTGGFTVNLSTTAGTLNGITDNGDGTYTATLTSSTSEETATISGTLEGENIDDTAEVNFVTEVLAPSPEFTTINASPNNILADGSSTSEITVTLRDENDDPVTTGGFDVTLSTTAGTLSSVTENGDGTYAATLTSSNTEETATISGTLEGEDIDDTATVNFVSEVTEPSPEHTQIAVNPNKLPADGESQATVTVTLFDENNDPITDGGFCDLLNLSTTAGSLGTITDNGDGTCTAPVTSDDEPGMAQITGSIDGETIDDTAELEFTALPPSPEFTTINASPNNILADGSSTSQITATLRDKNDNPVTTGGYEVNLSTTAGSLGNLTDNGDGTYTAILTSSTSEETATISGTLEGEEIEDTANVNFVEEVLEPGPEHTQISVNPDELSADGESQATVTVTLYDENNDPITEGGYCELIEVESSAGSLGDITDNGDGTCTLILTADDEPGTAEITASIEGEDVDDSAEVEFTALPPSPDFTQITASPKKILANGSSTSTITVTLRDENNNPVNTGGFDVSLSTTTGTLGNVTDNGDGTYTATLTSSTNEGTATISGTLEGEDIDDTAEVEFVEEILPPSGEFTTIQAAPTTLLADGESTSVITVTLRDENDEPVGQGGFNVTLSTTAGTLGDITDNGDGTYTAVLTSSNMVGTTTITGTVEGDNIVDTAEVEFVAEVLPPSADETTIEADPTEIAADGKSTSIITVTLRDENNDLVGQGGYNVDITTNAGILSSITDNGDGTYTAILTSAEIPETATISGTLEGEGINDTATVEFTVDETVPHPDYITIEANPTEIPADGASKSTITITLYNVLGEPITEGGYCSNIELTTSAGSLSGITDNGDGTCTAILTAPREPGQAVITATFAGDSIQKNVIVTLLSLDMFQCEVQTVYPNPFLDNATFRVVSPKAGRVTLSLFDILGKQVATVVDEDVTAGEHEFSINAFQLSGGLYIYRYECPCKCQTDTGRIIHAGRN